MALHRHLWILTLHLLISTAAYPPVYGVQLSPEVCGYIDRVVDGDTIWLYISDVYDPKYSGFTGKLFRVRLADINTPELGTIDGEEARDYLIELVGRYGSAACLDVDDVDIFDKYDRLLGILFLNYNSTHMVNINRLLVLEGYADIIDYPNEFDPYTMELYVRFNYEGGGLPPSYTVLSIVVIFILALAFYRLYMRGRRPP